MCFKSNVRPEFRQAILRQSGLRSCSRPKHSLLLSGKLSLHVPLISAQISLNIWANIKHLRNVWICTKLSGCLEGVVSPPLASGCLYIAHPCVFESHECGSVVVFRWVGAIWHTDHTTRPVWGNCIKLCKKKKEEKKVRDTKQEKKKLSCISDTFFN